MTPDLASLAALDCHSGRPVLQSSELTQRLTALPGWEHAGNQLTKTFRFANYYETMAFVNAVAYVAHRQDHHPDLTVSYNRLVVTYSTHDAGGVTLNDCICAAKVEALAG